MAFSPNYADKLNFYIRQFSIYEKKIDCIKLNCVNK